MDTLIIYPKTKEQLSALKAILKALKVYYRSEKNLYSLEFTEKILKEREDIKKRQGGKNSYRRLVEVI